MQCPICSSEISADVAVCDKCGAMRVVQRTPTGVIVGWFGMVMMIIWVMIAVPLVIFPLINFPIKDFPWAVLIIGAIISAGLLWYSKSTLHSKWVPSES